MNKIIDISGYLVGIGDYIKVRYKNGFGTICGNITKIWNTENGDKLDQVQLDGAWCFHEGDIIEEHKTDTLLKDVFEICVEPFIKD